MFVWIYLIDIFLESICYVVFVDVWGFSILSMICFFYS